METEVAFSLFSWLPNNLETIVNLITAIVGVFAIVATMTPNTADNLLVDKALKLTNFLGANVGKARNE